MVDDTSFIPAMCDHWREERHPAKTSSRDPEKNSLADWPVQTVEMEKACSLKTSFIQMQSSEQ